MKFLWSNVLPVWTVQTTVTTTHNSRLCRPSDSDSLAGFIAGKGEFLLSENGRNCRNVCETFIMIKKYKEMYNWHTVFVWYYYNNLQHQSRSLHPECTPLQLWGDRANDPHFEFEYGAPALIHSMIFIPPTSQLPWWTHFRGVYTVYPWYFCTMKTIDVNISTYTLQFDFTVAAFGIVPSLLT